MQTRVARRKVASRPLGSTPGRQAGLIRIVDLIRDARSGTNGAETQALNDLAVLTRTGDRNEARQAAEFLVEAFTPVVKFKARHFFMPGMDREDMVQEGMIGLTKAMRDFRPDRKASFRTFADTCIQRQMITAVKASRSNHGRLDTIAASHMHQPDDTKSSPDAFENRPGSDTVDPVNIITAREELERMREVIRDRLSPFENQVAERFTAGMTYAAIAEELECTPKSVDNALCRTRRKMRRYLQEHPDF